MLWGCFSSKGSGNLVWVHGIMNSMKYKDIFNLNLAAPARKLKWGCHWIFQQDNDPEHMSKSTENLLTEHKMNLLPSPSQSPDVHLWADLKRRMHKRGPRTLEKLYKEELFQIILSVFYNIISVKLCGGRKTTNRVRSRKLFFNPQGKLRQSN